MNTQNEIDMLRVISAKAPELKIETAFSIAQGIGELLAHSTPANVAQMPQQPLGDAPTTADDMSPTDKKKAVISKQIVELGGTPPEKGSLKKFEDTLAALQDTPPEEEDTGQEATSPPEEPTPETPSAPESTIPGLDEVRMLASYVVKNQEDFDGTTSSLGKTKLGACLKKVGAKSITLLFDEEDADTKVVEFVALLENNAGKSLEEVVAETSA